MAETIDDILRGAKAFLAKRTVVDDANDFANNQKRSSDVQLREEKQNRDRLAGDLTGAASMAALPASFLGGPVGAASIGYFALDALKRAIGDPSATNIGMAGASMLPGIGPLKRGAQALRGLGRGARVAEEAPVILNAGRQLGKASKAVKGADAGSEFGRAEMFDDVLSRQLEAAPSGTTFDMTGNAGRRPYASPTEFNPSERFMSNAPAAAHVPRADDAASQLVSSLERYSPNTGAASHLANADDAATQFAPTVERFAANTPGVASAPVADDAAMQAVSSLDRYAPNTSAMSHVASADDAAMPLTSGVERFTPNSPAVSSAADPQAAASALRSLILQGGSQFDDVLTRMPEQAPDLGPELEILDAARTMPGEATASVAAPGFSLGSVVDAPVSRAVQRRGRLDAEPQARMFREAQQHGVGGFNGLPELSLAEIARMTAGR